MEVEDFLDSKLIELNIDNISEIGYGDLINILEAYSNVKTQEIQDYILEQLKQN